MKLRRTKNMIPRAIHTVNTFFPTFILGLLVAFLPPVSVHAATLFNAPYIGTPWSVHATGGSFATAFYQTFFGATTTVSNPVAPPGGLTLSGTTTVRVVWSSGAGCSSLTPFIYYDSPVSTEYAAYSIASSTVGDTYCDITFVLSTTPHAYTGLAILEPTTPNGSTVLSGSNSNYGNSINGNNDASADGSFAYQVCDSGGCDESFSSDICSGGDTRICGFTPENGATLTGPLINFTLDAYIAPDDTTGTRRVRVQLANIDQNVLLLGFISPNTHELLNKSFGPGEDGHFTFATSTYLPDGNYRLEVALDRNIFYEWISNPLDRTAHVRISKQFVIGTPTTIGNLNQNGFNILNGAIASTSATSSVALVAKCNPLSGFDMVLCLTGLLVPDTGQIKATLDGARDGILTRAPWGYLTRFITIMSATSTTALPAFTAEVALNNASDTTELSYDPADMLSGGATLLNGIHDPYNDKTLEDITKPMVELTVALGVLITIITDLTGSHNHNQETGEVVSRRRKT